MILLWARFGTTFFTWQTPIPLGVQNSKCAQQCRSCTVTVTVDVYTVTGVNMTSCNVMVIIWCTA